MRGPAPAPPRRTPPRRTAKRWLPALLFVLLAAAGVYLAVRPKSARAVLTPQAMDFGEMRAGQASEEMEVVVSNGGERPMSVERLALSADAGDFIVTREECSAGEIPGAAACSIFVRFEPRGEGVRRDTLEIHGRLVRSPARLELTGTGIAPLLATDRELIQFPGQSVGTSGDAVSLEVSNLGSAALEIRRLRVTGDAVRDFRPRRDRCSGTTLAPEERCSVDWVFSPRAAGIRRAEVVFDSDSLTDPPPVALVGEGIWTGPALALESDELDFGEQLVGRTSAARSLTVVNRQAATVSGLQARLVEGGESFSIIDDGCRGTRLGAGASCEVKLAFAPRGEGRARGIVALEQEGAGSLDAELLGRGVAPRLVLRSGSLDFGRARVGEGRPIRTLRLENVGSAGTQVQGLAAEGADRGAFSIEQDGCSGRELSPAAGCAAQVVFRPRREGEHRATIVVRPAPHEGGQRVDLNGTGVAPRLALSLEMVDFGRVRRTTYREVEITASNPGTDELRIGRLTIAGDDGQFTLAATGCASGTVLPPGGVCVATVRYAPDRDGRGTARLTLDHDGISGPREVPLAGEGLPPPVPAIRAEPARLDFGAQPVGERSPILTVVLANPGTGRLELDEIRIGGEAAGDFSIVPATCDVAPHLVPGSDCSLGVRFIPSKGGERRARLVVRHNAAGGQLSIELIGRGLASQTGASAPAAGSASDFSRAAAAGGGR